MFVIQLAIYGLHELTEANLWEGSEALHWATEPYGPDGRYGQLLSYMLLALPVGWLAFAALFGSKKPTSGARTARTGADRRALTRRGHDRGSRNLAGAVSRRGYLDWLRGVAVLIMVEAHLFDAWVRVIDRSERPYQWAMVVGGFSAPLFLFLAGVAMALAAGSRLRKGLTASETAAIARRRGWQILGLAFLFRLQSFIISGGPFPQTLLKVDILNVMGLSMVLAAVSVGHRFAQRVARGGTRLRLRWSSRW